MIFLLACSYKFNFNESKDYFCTFEEAFIDFA